LSNTNKQNTLSNIAYTLFIVLASGWVLQVGSSIILPVIFAIILAIFLRPLEKKIQALVHWKFLSITLCYLSLIIPIILITTLFSIQFMNILDSLPSIGESLESGMDKILSQLKNWIPLINTDKLLSSDNQNLLKPLGFIGKGFATTTSFLTSLGLTLIYSFFFLYYQNNIKKFLLFQFKKKSRPEIKQTLIEIKDTIQAYLSGVGVVILVLAVMNSIGLSIIGIEYALFWGLLGGLLAIIPYVGTLLGGLLPFLFALSTADASWQPIAVLVYYSLIQILEGNLITPKIVGDKVDINPLFAILSIVFFGSFWGIAGVILALPVISILKIVLANFEETKAYAMLLSTELGEK